MELLIKNYCNFVLMELYTKRLSRIHSFERFKKFVGLVFSPATRASFVRVRDLSWSLVARWRMYERFKWFM